MAVRDDWQGKGVGTALMEAVPDLADNWLGLTRIELSVYTDNAAGAALYKKFGFEVEGHPSSLRIAQREICGRVFHGPHKVGWISCFRLRCRRIELTPTS